MIQRKGKVSCVIWPELNYIHHLLYVGLCTWRKHGVVFINNALWRPGSSAGIEYATRIVVSKLNFGGRVSFFSSLYCFKRVEVFLAFWWWFVHENERNLLISARLRLFEFLEMRAVDKGENRVSVV